ncbi:MAG TPA: crotonobetainyl-CoA--carnitine CoA-transferase [Verrucomicrobiae bacterium]|jgi:hypothetical protein|nr:crotonobetainyl-CoA--carnitine CoA-transferase [Verrucomicrobiae bacterium]
MARGSENFGVGTYPSSTEQLDTAKQLQALLESTPIPARELIDQFALYASPASLRRFIHFDRLYQKILDIPGSIMLFGVRWGRDLCTLQALAQMYEPMNHTRRILGFDTFSGWPSVSAKDGSGEEVKTGAYTVTESYEKHLAQVLATKRHLGTYSHLDRFELHKGDAPEKLAEYLSAHPETVVAFAYFDFDIYEPTKACATQLLPYFARGAVIAFDEFVHPVHPGETVAAREVFGKNAAFRRIPNLGPGHSAYLLFEEGREQR